MGALEQPAGRLVSVGTSQPPAAAGTAPSSRTLPVGMTGNDDFDRKAVTDRRLASRRKAAVAPAQEDLEGPTFDWDGHNGPTGRA